MNILRTMSRMDWQSWWNVNIATTVTRTVIIEDTTAADLTLNWSGSITLEVWSVYSELWAEFNDIVDWTGSAVVSGTVDTSTPWTYFVDYNYTDAAWNVSSTITRTVVIEDTTAPIITLNGSGTVTIEAWSTYSELWAEWTDNLDGT